MRLSQHRHAHTKRYIQPHSQAMPPGNEANTHGNVMASVNHLSPLVLNPHQTPPHSPPHPLLLGSASLAPPFPASPSSAASALPSLSWLPPFSSCPPPPHDAGPLSHSGRGSGWGIIITLLYPVSKYTFPLRMKSRGACFSNKNKQNVHIVRKSIS